MLGSRQNDNAKEFHQLLIKQLDMILAVNRGGKTLYFGLVGDNGSVVINYLASRGYQCPLTKTSPSLFLRLPRDLASTQMVPGSIGTKSGATVVIMPRPSWK